MPASSLVGARTAAANEAEADPGPLRMPRGCCASSSQDWAIRPPSAKSASHVGILEAPHDVQKHRADLLFIASHEQGVFEGILTDLLDLPQVLS